MNTTGTVAALDYGETRIGVALARLSTRLPRPYLTLTNDADILDTLAELVRKESISSFVVGLPRNLSGEDTEQTRAVRRFGEHLAQLHQPVVYQDEMGTSQQAETELWARARAYSKGDIDALSACLILERYFQENPNR